MPLRTTSTVGSAKGLGFTAADEIIPQGQIQYSGCCCSFTWVAPAGVTSVSVVAIAPGGSAYGDCGGQGGSLVWRNNIPVTPGQSYSGCIGPNRCRCMCCIGAWFMCCTCVYARHGGCFCCTSPTMYGDACSIGGRYCCLTGGGAAGYADCGCCENTGRGACSPCYTSCAGSCGGGSGGSGTSHSWGACAGGGGGGVGLCGRGSSGTAVPAGGCSTSMNANCPGSAGCPGSGGCYGSTGWIYSYCECCYGGPFWYYTWYAGTHYPVGFYQPPYTYCTNCACTTHGSGRANYGGGGGHAYSPYGNVYCTGSDCTGCGAVRIIWGPDRSFPNTNTGCLTTIT